MLFRSMTDSVASLIASKPDTRPAESLNPAPVRAEVGIQPATPAVEPAHEPQVVAKVIARSSEPTPAEPRTPKADTPQKAATPPSAPRAVATESKVSDPKAAAAHNQRGRDLFNQGKYAEALVELNLALDAQPDWPIALNGRGFAHLQIGRAHV